MDSAKIKQVVIDQQPTILPPHFIPRSAWKKVADQQNNNHIVVLSGIRRCGKSTLLQQLRQQSQENNYYINFDDERLVKFVLEDFQNLLEIFIELYGVQKTFYFDEIQNIHGWERFVRRLHDSGNKIYITGSNATMFSRELGTRLTGRYVEINIYPFSFYETITFPKVDLTRLKTIDRGKLKALYADYNQKGGFPEFRKYGQSIYLQTLYESIIYRDIVARYKINERAIRELAYYLASNITCDVSYNSLRKLLGLASTTTVSDYCTYLENSFLCFFINRFDPSLKKQMNYVKKVYFIDTALAKILGFGISENKGSLLENLVFMQLKRMGKEIYFHRGKTECDFVIREGIKITSAIQVTVSLDNPATKKRELTGLLDAMEIYDLQEGYILTENEESMERHIYNGKKKVVNFIPVWKWLAKD